MFFCGARTLKFQFFSFTLIIFTHWHLTGMRIAHGPKSVCFDVKGGWVVETIWVFSKVIRKFFDFYPSAKTLPLFECKTTHFHVFSYTRPVNKIIVIFQPILRNFQDIFFKCIKWTLSRFVAEHFLWGPNL